MSKYKVEISGVDTSYIEVLSNSEMNELFQEMQNGNLEARTKLVEGNLKLVLSILQRFHHRVENMDDLFQIGCVGLLKAIDNFDLSHEVKFSTYAVPMIIGEIRRYLRDNNPIRVSRSMRDLAYRALMVKESITKHTQKEPTVDQIAKELGVDKEDVAFSLDAIQDPVSLQDSVYGDNTDNIYIMDQISDKKNTDERWTENITLSEAMKRLNDKEKLIISKRFFECRTQMEVADEIGISQAQVSRLEKTAIDHIKKFYK